MGGIAPTILTFQDVCRLSGCGVPFNWGVFRSGLLICCPVMCVRSLRGTATIRLNIVGG